MKVGVFYKKDGSDLGVRFTKEGRLYLDKRNFFKRETVQTVIKSISKKHKEIAEQSRQKEASK